MPDRHVLVLAAGKGTRMKSSRPKVLHWLAGYPLIAHVLRAAESLGAKSTIVLVGHKADTIEHALTTFDKPLRFIRQPQQLGTAHALLQAEATLKDKTGTLIVLSGDTPLISAHTLRTLAETHERSSAAMTVLTATIERPYGYGRILRHKGQLLSVVEEVDATPDQRAIREVNSGTYAFDLAHLFATLQDIPEAGVKNERYLPATLALYRRQQRKVASVVADNPYEILGINSQSELAEVSSIVRQRKNEELMAAGVTIDDPATTYIDIDVLVGPDTVIHPGVFLEGNTVIGARCELHAGVRIVDTNVADDVTINNHTVIIASSIKSKAHVGPFAHIRPGSTVGEKARVGNFVELKKSNIGTGSKANHLSYVGDANIGPGVNIGAGTITCNYDGTNKYQTTVESDVFIGSGTELVAPVTIGQGAYVAAGSCITEDVPAGALALARSRQINKENRTEKVRKKAD